MLHFFLFFFFGLFSLVSLTELCSMSLILVWFERSLHSCTSQQTNLSLTIKTDDVTSGRRDADAHGRLRGDWVKMVTKGQSQVYASQMCSYQNGS